MPEAWFRILHIQGEGQNGVPVAACREQTVEIALEPKREFENGNIGVGTKGDSHGRRTKPRRAEEGDTHPPRDGRTDSTALTPDILIEWDGYSD